MGGIVDEAGGSVLEGEWPMRLERAAMAALRCTLEPAHAGPLDVARVRYLGDAVMWQ